MDPRRRVRLAWWMLAGSILGCPISAFTFARDEPPTVLLLSWGAMAITAWDVICTSDTRARLDEDGDG